ncbi:MAG TPA: carboxypeptidase regulatory-like domain-containing protein [Terriglobales bacterium]|jgi:hypothetical protein|nr:carboxypeptidase regulatory-like domain-containing protein [Terriglobales bacterium]
MRVRKTKGLLALAVLLSLFAVTLPVVFAQVTTTNIAGTVTDASGASVAGAQVTVTNTGTNQIRTTQTNAQGDYRLEFLPVGSYSVEVSAPSFKKMIRSGIVLQADQPARVDAQLQLGQVTETVQVTSDIPLVNTSNPEIGRTIDSHEIINLPIVNRNAYTLLDLVPGVQKNDNSIVLGYPEQRTLINGGIDAGAGSVNYYLDGGINMTGLRNTGNILPNPDAIQEFRVQTNNYAADYGRFQNGIVNTITKSGTNNFHGSLFEFVRNTVFNANTWANTGATPPLHRNQFGGTIGGPVIKNKTFFFGSYAGLREITNTFLNGATVPSALERTGDFSQSNGRPVIPGSQTTTGTGGTRYANDQLTGLDPVAMNIINKFIPVANLPNNKWQGVIPNPYNSDEFLAKVDHNLSDSQRLSVSYFETSGENKIRSGTANLPWSIQQFSWRQHNANVSHTWSLNPNMVNQVWIGYTRNFGGRLNLPQTSLSDLGSAAVIQGTPSLPQIGVTSFFNLTQAIAGPVAGTNYYSLRDVFSVTHGRHAFRFGGELSLDKDIQATLLNNYGVFGFNGTATLAGTKGASCLACGLADFELGIPNSISQDAPVTALTNSWYTSLFAQDDFRVTPRLTLNLGVRWDVQTPPTDPQDKESTFVPGVQSTVRPTAPAGILFPGDPGITRGIVPIQWNHVSPRVGFALDPFGTGKTSIRAAAGVFYGSVSGNEWNTTSNFEPFAVRLSLANVNVKGTGATLSNPYKGLTPAPFPYNGGFVSGGSIFGPSPNFRWPYTYQLNFSVQQQLTQSLSLQIAYVGSLSHNLPFATDINYPLPSSTATTAGANILSRRPNKAFGTIFAMRSDQTASYNGLQISAQQRMSHHLTFSGWYAWAKAFDSVQIDNSTAQGLVQDFSNPRADRGRADIDARHTAVISLTYQPDYYTGDSRVVRSLINGWSISPIVRLHTGLPFSVSNGADANLDGNNNDRAQLIGDPHISNPNAAQWFNTAAFAKNAVVTGVPVDGSSPRNFLDAPGYKNVDLAIFRNFPVTERFKLEFRAEASNVLNIVNLNTPSATVGTNNFGQITTAQPMRQLQLGLRLTY